jgi:hypothetical protein
VNAEGKPYAGNPHVRFDEGLLARALRTAGWSLLHHQTVGCDRRIAGISVRTAGSRSSRTSRTSSTLLAALPGVRPDIPRAACHRERSERI